MELAQCTSAKQGIRNAEHIGARAMLMEVDALILSIVILTSIATV